ncbi:MAG: thioredoxin family protein [Bacteroidales bacterium]|nr:thioredoxin family protein [Bacteroidales bacterium]MCM1146305.1 thioredoxin family protein [Bacteroidales bacterium]MCM1205257.1 thioredoxin family protein [Bacillota bacterium]MCM1509658.1 thioredoxin family protein [Clostridium sp.]
MTRKTVLCLSVLLLCMVSAMAQVTFKPSVKQTSADEITVTFSGKIDSGWHVYSPDEKNGPIPASFNVEAIEGAKVVGGLKADKAPVRTYEDMFGATVSYYENSVTFTQRLKLTGKSYKVQGYLEYGACSNQSCLPPASVEFSYNGTVKGAAAEDKAEAAAVTGTPADMTAANAPEAKDSVTTDSATVAVSAGEGLWTPVIKELAAFENGDTPGGSADGSLLTIFVLGILGGFIALLTPCVWPIIPMTVSFFLKRAKEDKRKGIRDAFTYGLSIIVIYLALGLAVTLLFGASALNALSTNAVFNIFFFLLLVVFGASFLGGFEIVLPSSWTNAVDSKASSTTGLLSIFLMAFTLALVSFSCTGPIIGFLLVEMGTSGNITGPAVGMFGFALALALPFTLFAVFPTWLKSVPKSGNWMNNVKVTLGFVELAFSLKFLSVADLAYGWHILDREVFLSLWIVIFFLLGCYLVGWIRFPHDEDEWDEMGEKIINHRTPVTKLFMALCSFAFAIYMIPGLWGAPCKAVSAFAPPMSTQDFNLAESETIEARYKDFEAGMEEARRQGKPVMIDFTGFGCVNCRKMEAAVWTDEGVKAMITDDYVLVQLFVDDKTPLPEPVEVMENGTPRKLRTVGDKWSYFQRTKFGSNTQPFYVLLDNEGKPLNAAYSYDEDIPKYKEFLSTGLRNYKR